MMNKHPDVARAQIALETAITAIQLGHLCPNLPHADQLSIIHNLREFMVLLNHTSTPESSARNAHELIQALKEGVRLLTNPLIQITCSSAAMNTPKNRHS